MEVLENGDFQIQFRKRRLPKTDVISNEKRMLLCMEVKRDSRAFSGIAAIFIFCLNDVSIIIIIIINTTC